MNKQATFSKGRKQISPFLRGPQMDLAILKNTLELEQWTNRNQEFTQWTNGQ